MILTLHWCSCCCCSVFVNLLLLLLRRRRRCCYYRFFVLLIFVPLLPRIYKHNTEHVLVIGLLIKWTKTRTFTRLLLSSLSYASLLFCHCRFFVADFSSFSSAKLETQHKTLLNQHKKNETQKAHTFVYLVVCCCRCWSIFFHPHRRCRCRRFVAVCSSFSSANLQTQTQKEVRYTY